MPLEKSTKGDLSDGRAERIDMAVVNYQTRQQYADAIKRHWKKAAENFLVIGRYLNKVKDQLGHGEYEKMVSEDLPFGRGVAHQLRNAAEFHDSGKVATDLLPPNYSTVYLISTLSDEDLGKAVQQQIIRPDTSRREIVEYKRNLAPLSAPAPARVDREALRRRRQELIDQQRQIAEELAQIMAELGDEDGMLIEGTAEVVQAAD